MSIAPSASIGDDNLTSLHKINNISDVFNVIQAEFVNYIPQGDTYVSNTTHDLMCDDTINSDTTELARPEARHVPNIVNSSFSMDNLLRSTIDSIFFEVESDIYSRRSLAINRLLDNSVVDNTSLSTTTSGGDSVGEVQHVRLRNF